MSDTASNYDRGSAHIPVKILVATGDEQSRAGFAQALSDYPGSHPVQLCSTSDEAVRLAVAGSPDVVLVDTDLTPQNGFTTVQQIMAEVPGLSALLVTRDPAPEDFRRALRAGARDMLELPVDKQDLFAAVDAALAVSRAKRGALEDIAARALAEEKTQTATRIVIFSTKGGTGKTFVATNVAAGLARTGKRVAIVDLDLQFGDVAIALGLTPERTMYDLVQMYTAFDVTLMGDFMLKHKSGLHVLPAPLYPDQSEQITTQDIETILRVVESGYDYVVVDTPPFFEERVLVALDWADYVLLLAGLDLPSVKNLKLSFTTMDLMAYPMSKLRIVINRAGSKVGLDVSDVERHLGRKVHGTISSSIDVPRSLNTGEVLLLTKPNAKVSQELSQLVGTFAQAPSNNKRRAGLFRRS